MHIVIFKPGQPHRFPASFAFEIGLRTLTKTGPYMEERRVFVSRSENHQDTMRMTTNELFVVTSSPLELAPKRLSIGTSLIESIFHSID